MVARAAVSRCLGSAVCLRGGREPATTSTDMGAATTTLTSGAQSGTAVVPTLFL